jgi:hypothetical protein
MHSCKSFTKLLVLSALTPSNRKLDFSLIYLLLKTCKKKSMQKKGNLTTFTKVCLINFLHCVKMTLMFATKFNLT